MPNRTAGRPAPSRWSLPAISFRTAVTFRSSLASVAATLFVASPSAAISGVEVVHAAAARPFHEIVGEVLVGPGGPPAVGQERRRRVDRLEDRVRPQVVVRVGGRSSPTRRVERQLGGVDPRPRRRARRGPCRPTRRRPPRCRGRRRRSPARRQLAGVPSYVPDAGHGRRAAGHEGQQAGEAVGRHRRVGVGEGRGPALGEARHRAVGVGGDEALQVARVEPVHAGTRRTCRPPVAAVAGAAVASAAASVRKPRCRMPSLVVAAGSPGASATDVA